MKRIGFYVFAFVLVTLSCWLILVFCRWRSEREFVTESIAFSELSNLALDMIDDRADGVILSQDEPRIISLQAFENYGRRKRPEWFEVENLETNPFARLDMGKDSLATENQTSNPATTLVSSRRHFVKANMRVQFVLQARGTVRLINLDDKNIFAPAHR